ncbi:MAG: cytochrome c biogenesis protein DipZ [Candidatus Doudnabacteria bacterium]
MIQILFAILAGVLTIGAPCILPLLPVLLGTSIGHTSKTRPLYIVSGFVIVFAVLGVFLSYLTRHLGLNPNILRNSAIVLLGIFGVFMIWSKPFELLTMRLNGVINRASQAGKLRSDNLGGFILGMTLGVVWTPCAGPVLGAILTLIALQANFVRSLVLLAAYAIGAGIPMLIIAYASQAVTTKIRGIAKYSVLLQRIFGILIILLAVAMYYNFDIQIENQLANIFPTSTLESKLVPNNNPNRSNGTAVDIKNYGPSPEFTGIDHWLNSDPLTMKELKGKVVLIDFWTYSCINCIRTLPFVTKWYDTYKDKGFVVVGVHSPEFEFEKDTANVADAIKRFKINYPVAQDNELATWNAYSNQYWPAEYLIDQNGNVVYFDFGEGNYDKMENAIRTLLGLGTESLNEPGQDLSGIGSPEMYFGTDRLANLTSQQQPSSKETNYSFPSNLDLNDFALSGAWQFSSDKITMTKPSGKIRLKFHSGKVHIVADSPTPQKISITVDGKTQPDVMVGASELYTLFDSADYTDHTIEITIPAAGFEAFTFTFG